MKKHWFSIGFGLQKILQACRKFCRPKGFVFLMIWADSGDRWDDSMISTKILKILVMPGLQPAAARCSGLQIYKNNKDS